MCFCFSTTSSALVPFRPRTSSSMTFSLLRQGFDDPVHGSARQRGITHQPGIEGLPGEQSGQQAHAGAGIAAIDGAIRRLQAVQADTVHDAPSG